MKLVKLTVALDDGRYASFIADEFSPEVLESIYKRCLAVKEQ